MSRYYLIASYYNMYNRTYSNEVKVKEIEGVKLSSLVRIDKITSKYSRDDLLKIIAREMKVDSLNHLAIKCVKDNGFNSEYYRVISNDKLYSDCIDSLGDAKVVTILGKTKTTFLINKNNELYKQELEVLENILRKRDLNLFSEIYSKNNDFSFLVRRYLTASYDNELEKEKDYKLILLEFSRYKTFRGWYVEKLKKNDYVKRSNKVVGKVNNKSKEVKVATYEENMREFEKNFVDKHNMAYDEFRTYQYNVSNDDKEEFLDINEYNMMDDYDEEVIDKELNSKSLGRRH